jgi:UTP--glucose-1-phosphate uridylyltransferase
MTIKTAVFPVAGLGTRFLPATKATPKELLPLIDRPLIQYAIDEAKAAGIEEFIFVTSPDKPTLEAYLTPNPGLEAHLAEKGKLALVHELQGAGLPAGAAKFIYQEKALGLGDAVRRAAPFVGDEAFAVILPDDVIVGAPCLAEMVEAWTPETGSMVATMEVSPEEVSSYGVIDPHTSVGRMVRAKNLVEKPAVEDAPSRHAVVGRYILTADVMRRLENTGVGAGGEIQLTDAIAASAREGGSVNGFRFSGRRHDCGDKAGYLRATIDLAMNHPTLGAGFAADIAAYAPAIAA